jgi:hypothetical protein
MKQGFVAGLLLTGLGVVGAGCLSRPVEHTDPSLKTNFTAVVENKSIDKLDILFDIDNSASMGDKQAYLQTAIPDLINRLVNPNCVDTTGGVHGPSVNGTCAGGMYKPEVTPVHDMHLGIISSSLGARGGDACGAGTMALPPFQNVLAHNDDQAHLLDRSLTYMNNGAMVTEGVVADAPAPDQYLYWFPTAQNMGKTPGKGTPINSATQLITDFTALVGGTGVFGCGIESQLESWYRFLVQPDPYASIGTTTDGSGNKHGNWQGVDQTILQQRADFLRPDSLVLIVVLTDEDDSEIDVRSISGLGVNWMAAAFDPPNGTSACASGPGNSACQSCAQGNNAKTDSNCMTKPVYTALNDWGYDLNLRHVHMKMKYGVDPQFPMQRYVTGLTSKVVPDRNGEYPPTGGNGSYAGMNDCVNPLFATGLPSSGTDSTALCKLTAGPRTKDLVFYAHIGGVPSSLLHFTPGDPAKSTLTNADWVKILGNGLVNGPDVYDTSGIDPHMIEDYKPRSGIAPPGSPNNADLISGHDWITDQPLGVMGGHVLQVDRQYACIFQLSDSNGNATTRDCSLAQNANFCDCPHMAGTVNAMQLPPLCDQTTITKQVSAKAYPTIRELTLAYKMGKQGIVSSICPIHTADNPTKDDPLYGYRPAVAAIIDRLKDALTNTCLPQQLAPHADGSVDCLILLQIPPASGAATGTCLNPNCDPNKGLNRPPADVLPKFCASLEDAYNSQVSAAGSSTGLIDPANVPVCALTQLTMQTNPNDFQAGSCAAAPTDNGWCYVTGAAAGKCPQAILFTKNAIPNGATSNLQCLEQSVGVLDSGTSTSTGGGGG